MVATNASRASPRTKAWATARVVAELYLARASGHISRMLDEGHPIVNERPAVCLRTHSI